MISSLLTIALLHWAVLLVPGFNFILIGQLAAGGSRRSAIAAVIGMTTATFVWALLAVAGVGAVFVAIPTLRQVAQIVGGFYLLYLAYQLLRSGTLHATDQKAITNPKAAFRAGFVTSALNPKIALFYGSVFATALPANPSASNVIAAVLLVYANSWIWHGLLAFALSLSGVQQAYLRNYAMLTRISALLVGAFGFKLIFATMQEVRSRISVNL